MTGFEQNQTIDQTGERSGDGESGEKRTDRKQERAENVCEDAHDDGRNCAEQHCGDHDRQKVQTELDALRRTDRSESGDDDLERQQDAERGHGFGRETK